MTARAIGDAFTKLADGKYQAYVVSTPKDGLFVGYAFGLGFWSLLDAAGQYCIPIFPSAAEGREVINQGHGEGYCESAHATFHCITVEHLDHATAQELDKAVPTIPPEMIAPLRSNSPN